MPYLLKTEPSIYSFTHLQRDKTTIWDGVTNPAAVKNLRAMKPGDALVIYHTGKVKSAVGTASVMSVDAKDPKKPLVKIKVCRSLPRPVPLSEIKKHFLFQDSPLAREPRLSVVPLTQDQYTFLITPA